MTTPNTDRELLELAAKAVGLSVGYDSGQYFYCEHGPFGASMYGRQGNTPLNWNPLADDGDALRLAVKLKIDTEFDDWNGKEIVTADASEDCTGWLEEDWLPDPYAATRRAIVRVAAEIGKAMP